MFRLLLSKTISAESHSDLGVDYARRGQRAKSSREREREERTNFAHNFVFVYINMNFTTRSQLVLKDDSHIPH